MTSSWRKELTDFTWYGDTVIYLFGLFVGGAIFGALAGWAFGHPGAGASVGANVGLVGWALVAIYSFRRIHRKGYNGRRRLEQPPDHVQD